MVTYVEPVTSLLDFRHYAQDHIVAVMQADVKDMLCMHTVTISRAAQTQCDKAGSGTSSLTSCLCAVWEARTEATIETHTVLVLKTPDLLRVIRRTPSDCSLCISQSQQN